MKEDSRETRITEKKSPKKSPREADAGKIDIPKEELVDAQGLILDTSVPMEERGRWLAEKLGDPCCFRVGDVGVKLEFADEGPSLQALLDSFMERKKSGI